MKHALSIAFLTMALAAPAVGQEATDVPDWAEPRERPERTAPADSDRFGTDGARTNEPGPPEPPDKVPGVPVDGGLPILFGLGLTYGAYRIRRRVM